MVSVSPRLIEHCRKTPERMAWLERLPETIAGLAGRWRLSLGDRFEGEGDVSWVAPVQRHDGSSAVLKLGMPHMEAEHEIDALRFWNGDPTVRLLDADDALGAMLLERCEPGSRLREIPEDEQDRVIARLLPRLWRSPPAGHPFRSLATMVDQWIRDTVSQREHWPDEVLVRAGIETFREMSGSAAPAVLLATDLHAGNVLSAAREPWLVIDPKPFIGDPAYDLTQHLLNWGGRFSADPRAAIVRLARLVGVDADRVRRWTFARLAAEPRERWRGDRWLDFARILG